MNALQKVDVFDVGSMSIVILVPSSWMVNSRIKDSDGPFGVIWYHWGTPKSNGDHIQIL